MALPLVKTLIQPSGIANTTNHKHLSMSQSNYQHLFTGSSIDVLAIRDALSEVNITPVVKDESASATLAGFGVTAPLQQRVFVHNDEFEQATQILEQLF